MIARAVSSAFSPSAIRALSKGLDCRILARSIQYFGESICRMPLLLQNGELAFVLASALTFWAAGDGALGSVAVRVTAAAVRGPAGVSLAMIGVGAVVSPGLAIAAIGDGA